MDIALFAIDLILLAIHSSDTNAGADSVCTLLEYYTLQFLRED